MSVPSDQRDFIGSTLLPTVLAHTGSRRELRVLDLGVGVGQTIEIVSAERPCQFFFADVGRHVRSSYDGSSPGLLPFIVPNDVKFDICFFWDYLNLMNDQAMRQFAAEIDGYLSERTLVHGFLAADQRLPMPYRQYKLFSNSTIEHVNGDRFIARFPKSRQDFEHAFPQLKCENVVLFPGNRQEILAAVKVEN